MVGATLPILSALADKSLLKRDHNGRYQIHELLRQFAAEKLQQRMGESEQVRDRHCVYFGSFVQARNPERVRGREQKETFQAIVSEVDNLRFAWLWAIERGYMEVAERFIGAFSVLATVRGWFHEMIRLFDKAIAQLRPAFTPVDNPTQPAPSRQTTLLFGQLLTMQASFYRHVGLLGARPYPRKGWNTWPGLNPTMMWHGVPGGTFDASRFTSQFQEVSSHDHRHEARRARR